MKRSLILISTLFLISNIASADIISANDALARGDYAVAATEFKKLAEDGDARAQAHLGYMYYVGEGVSLDYTEAVKWYRKAAVQGNRDAQYNLAVAYAFGEGIKQNLTEAAIWYRRAAEQEHMISQYSLGISYAYGEGVPQDAAEAARWFKMAADQGYARAQVQLGSMYHTGDGIGQDYTEAVKWYRMAADRGDVTAQYNLGAMYRSGRGVDQDYAQAKRWFRMAADQGYAAAQNELASLERSVPATVAQQTKPQITPENKANTETSPILIQAQQQTVQQASKTPDISISETQIQTPAETENKDALFTVDKDTLLSLDETTSDDEPAPLIEEEITPDKIEQGAESEEYTAETTEQKSSGGLFGALGKLFGTKQPKAETETETLVEEPGEEESSTEPEIIVSTETEMTSGEDADATSQEIQPDESAPPPVTKVHEEAITTTTGQSEGAEVVATTTTQPDATETETTSAVTETASNNNIEEDSRPYQLFGLPIAQTKGDKSSGNLFGNLFKRDQKDTKQVDEDVDTQPETLLAKAETESPALVDEELAQEAEGAMTPKSISAGREALARGDYSAAMDQFLPLATQGDRDAQAHLGSMYYVGKGVPQDYGKAYDWYRRAAEQGDMDAQYSIGNMYLLGESVEQNNDLAREWYTKAAEQGHVAAQHNLDNLQRLNEQLTQQMNEEASSVPGHEEDFTEPEQAEPLAETEKKSSGGLFGFFGKLFTSDKQTDTEPVVTVVEEQSATEDQSHPDESTVETTVTTYAESEAPTGETLTALSDDLPLEDNDEPAMPQTEAMKSDTTEVTVFEDAREITTTESSIIEQSESPVADEVEVVETASKPSFFNKLFGPGTSKTSTVPAEPYDITPEGDENIVAIAEETPETELIPEPSTTSLDPPTESDMAQQDEDMPSTNTTASSDADTTEGRSGGLFGFFGKLLGSSGDDATDEQATDVTEQTADAGEAQTADMQAMLDNDAPPSRDQGDILSESITEVPIVANPDMGIDAIEKGDYETALEVIKPLAVAGNTDAQYQLGTLYYEGSGVKQDYTQASLWYRRAAELGNADAQYSLGNMYLMGEGVYQDNNEAGRWYAKAAEQGHIAAMHNLQNLKPVNTEQTQTNAESDHDIESESVTDDDLAASFNEQQTSVNNRAQDDYKKGLAYAFGDNVPQDDKTAYTWFIKAAEQGYAPAQYKVGVAYAYGEGVERNLTKAAEWYRKAADQGYIIAQRNLGTLYLNGDGVDQDKVQALAWYVIVADSGNAMDIRRRDTLRSELSDSQLRQSETLASELSSRLPN